MRNIKNFKLILCSMIVFEIYILLFSFATYTDIVAAEKSTSPFGIDYAIFYTASKMAINGQAKEIYNVDKHHKELEKVINRETPHLLGWFYPPNFLFFTMPFSVFPYYISLIIWNTITFILAICSIYLISCRNKYLTFLACSYPGVLMNLRWGQNGFVNTALLGFGIYFMEFNPMLSGIMFGLLTYKPQIAIFPLLILLLAKKWKVIFWTIIFTFIICITSGLIFGFDIWVIYVNNMIRSSAIASDWNNIVAIQPTIYSTLRLLGIEGNTIKFLLVIIALITTTISIWICRKTKRIALRGTIMVLGIFLVMPYYLQYDLMLLCIPYVLLLLDFIEYGYKSYEIYILFSLWLMPLINWPVVLLSRVQICNVVVMAVLILIVIRVKRIDVRYNVGGLTDSDD